MREEEREIEIGDKFCGGEIVERVIELEYRWKGRLYIIEGGSCRYLSAVR